MPAIPSWVAPYVGIPYVPLGRTTSGWDCWGLVALVEKEQFGREIPLYDAVGWEDGADRKAVAEYMAQQKALSWERTDDPVDGDVVLINMLGSAMHVGILIGHGLMLHCERGCNSCVESYTSPRWKKRIEGFYRFKG